MTNLKRRIFKARGVAGPRRLAAAAIVLAAVGWTGAQFLHPEARVPECGSDPAKREVVRSIALKVARQARDISLARSHERDEGDGKAELKPGAPRHCAAVAEVEGEQPRVVRYNIEPVEEAPGYHVAVFEHRPPEQRR